MDPIVFARGNMCVFRGWLFPVSHDSFFCSQAIVGSGFPMSSLYVGTRVNSLSEGKSGNVIIFGATLLRLCLNLGLFVCCFSFVV